MAAAGALVVLVVNRGVLESPDVCDGDAVSTSAPALAESCAQASFTDVSKTKQAAETKHCFAMGSL